MRRLLAARHCVAYDDKSSVFAFIRSQCHIWFDGTTAFVFCMDTEHNKQTTRRVQSNNTACRVHVRFYQCV